MKLLPNLLFLTAALLITVLSGSYALTYISDRSASIQSDIRKERMMQDELNARISTLKSNAETANFPDTLSFSASDELEAELLFQKAVLDLAEQHGINPLAFGPAGPVDDVTRNTVSLDLEFEIGYARALDFLHSMEASLPPIAPIGLTIRQIPAGALQEEETPVYVIMRIWGFWDLESEVK